MREDEQFPPLSRAAAPAENRRHFSLSASQKLLLRCHRRVLSPPITAASHTLDLLWIRSHIRLAIDPASTTLGSASGVD